MGLHLLRSLRKIGVLYGALLLILTACTPGGNALPTVSSIEMAGTAVALTQQAPPQGFQTTISYPLLDAKLVRLPSWYARLLLSFEGVDAVIGQPATARLEAQIYRNELSNTRRVLFSANGIAFGVAAGETRNIEAVRIANDYYFALKTPPACAAVTDAARRQIADLTAGSLIGGIQSATATGNRQPINGQLAYEYTFLPESLNLTVIQTDNVGKFTIAAGSLWVAPSLDAVMRYTLTVNVQDVRLLNAEQPVTGQLRIEYELKEVGSPYNLAVPFGC
jgi:hypothetical protein